MYEAGADVVLNGHSHNYERFALQNPTAVADSGGIREFVVGTGGASLDALGTRRANSEVFLNSAFGVLKLTLRPLAYDWQLVTESSSSADSGGTACH